MKNSRIFSPVLIAIVFALFTTCICNFVFFKAIALDIRWWADLGLIASILCFLFLLSLAVALLFSFKYLLKPFFTLILCLNAVAIYFMHTYHVMIEKTMLQNVLHTDLHEVKELLHVNMLYYFLIFALIPSVMLLKTKIAYPSFKKSLLKNSMVLCVVFLLTLIMVFINYPKFSTFVRANRDQQQYIVPLNYLNAIVKYTKMRLRSQQVDLPILEDATLDSSVKPTVFVLVVGETARAKNFSLYGYERKTNPLLEQDPLFVLNPATSCGTSTAVSLPCIFSHLSGQEFRRKHQSYMFLPEALKRLSIQTHWVDNNFGGCYSVCSPVDAHIVNHANQPKFCDETGCVDMILLEKIDQFLSEFDQKSMLIVLHMNGSHGPLYYKRYPAFFAKFDNACQQSRVNECEPEQLVNAYDNTILYTDYVLHTLIQKLNAHADLPIVMLYASDHGESLGEHHLFLHGFPYAIAPKEQTEIPFLLFANDAFKKQHPIDIEHFKKSNTAYSHDNIFHTVLGVFGVHTQYYQKELDLFQNNTDKS